MAVAIYIRAHLVRQLVDESGHPIYPGIAGADHGDVLPGKGVLDGHPAPVDLLHHPGGLVLLVREELLEELHIGRVSRDYVGGFYGVHGTEGHVLLPARTESDHCQSACHLNRSPCGIRW